MRGTCAPHLLEDDPGEQADKAVQNRCKLRFQHLKTLVTFIRALESSPVHCLKFLPSGNLRRPANGGVIAMLDRTKYTDIHYKGIDLTAGQYHREFSLPFVYYRGECVEEALPPTSLNGP
jgi:hypothetical protein